MQRKVSQLGIIVDSGAIPDTRAMLLRIAKARLVEGNSVAIFYQGESIESIALTMFGDREGMKQAEGRLFLMMNTDNAVEWARKEVEHTKGALHMFFGPETRIRMDGLVQARRITHRTRPIFEDSKLEELRNIADSIVIISRFGG